MKKNNNISQKIKELMLEQGLTQVDLATLAGITPQTMVNIMRNKNAPKRVTLEKIADALGVYTEYLTGEIIYKTYDAWIEANDICTPQQVDAAKTLLKSFGYSVIKQDAFYILLECPDKTQKVLTMSQLNTLIISFNNSLDNFLLPRDLLPDNFI